MGNKNFYQIFVVDSIKSLRWRSLKFALKQTCLEARYHPIYWTLFTFTLWATQYYAAEWTVLVMFLLIFGGTFIKIKFFPDTPEHLKKLKIIKRAFRIQNPDL